MSTRGHGKRQTHNDPLGRRRPLPDDYLRWNTAVADVIYPVTDEPVPAYMDLEADVLRRIADAAHATGGEASNALPSAVRSVTVDERGSLSLNWLLAESRRWKRRSTDPPPCLAFLAVSVLAAEHMGNAEAGLSAHAYYPRLARVLSLDDNSRARAEYVKAAEFLWGCLNTWLQNLEGERGLPTAYALTHRYVGLPMSQALLRGGDRRKLPEMFVQFGLNPGMRLAPEDLTTYLNEWISAERSSASATLRRLWRRKESHERIAAIAAVELANWDGTGHSASGPSVGRVMLMASLRNGFLGDSLDLALGIRPLIDNMDGRMEVLRTVGDWADLAFSPNVAGLWRTTYAMAIDFASILSGVVRIRHAEDSTLVEYKRFPTTVIPLIYDELQSTFVQAERLQLGIDAMLLVRITDQPPASKAMAEAERILHECARPGYSKLTEIDGLPPGWALFTDVQLFKAPSSTTSLNELVPLARTQLTIAGGLRIPSRIRKWSSLSPPEIRATAQGDLRLRIVLYKDPNNEQLLEEVTDSGSLIVDLAAVGLADGDYHVALFTGGGKEPTQQTSFRLRSSDEVDRMWEQAPRLVYWLDTALGALTASEEPESERYIDGLVAEGSAEVAPSIAASSKVFWSSPQRVQVRRTIQVGTPDPKSCVVTGAHRIDLPRALGQKVKFIDGTCSQCGLVKRYPGWLPRSSGTLRKSHSEHALPEVTVADLPTVARHPVDWTAAMDALLHMGGGAYSSLQSVAAQLDGSALFTDVFTRQLEALGHIAIERDSRWQPQRWEVSSTCLAEAQEGRFRLTGFWPKEAADSLIASHGIGAGPVHSGDGPATAFLTGITITDAERIAEAHEATFVPATGVAALETLPRLSEVAEALPRSSMPGFDSLERFDLESASWTTCVDPSIAGAYRLRRGFEVLYLYRSNSDVDAGQAAVTNVYLAKHLAANAIGETLLVYMAEPQTLLVPRGCDLPGLYARAAVAFSGELPKPQRLTVRKNRRNCLSYRSIDRAGADLFATLFTT